MRIFRRNVELHPYRPMSAWRKIAVGTWLGPKEPNIYARIRVDARAMLQRIEDLKAHPDESEPRGYDWERVRKQIEEWSAAR